MQALAVIKIGGNVIDSETLLTDFLTQLATIQVPKILIHGGGKIATQLATRMGVDTVMQEGRRITDAPMLEIVTMVYGGLVNKKIVGKLQSLGVNALGLTGADGHVVRAHRRPVNAIDYGFVGDIEQVNTQLLTALLNLGLMPVLAPLSWETAGGLLNTNADTLAAEVAKSLASHYQVNLVYCFEKPGVMRDIADAHSVIPKITPQSYQILRAEGVVADGMIPKLDNAFASVAAGVHEVTICHASDIHQTLATGSAGTRLLPD